MTERGVYSLSGPLSDVEFRLNIEFCEPTALQSFDAFTENAEQASFAAPSILIEKCTFKWQQKLPLNRTRVSQEITQDCFQQHDSEQNLTSSKRNEFRVFTLVNGEKPAGIKEINEEWKNSSENKLTDNFAVPMNRRIEPIITSHWNPIIDLPSKEHQKKIRSVQYVKETMYIMACLGPIQDNNTQEYEDTNQYVICKITTINETNVIIEPDLFSTNSKIETPYGTYKAHLFIIKNDNLDTISDDDLNQTSYEGNRIIMTDIPAEKTTEFIYLIDIERAINFAHDGLSVEYKVDTPLQCTVIDSSLLQRRSFISDSCPRGKDDEAVFSQQICITLVIKEMEQFLADFHWPRIIFRVSAEDYWGHLSINGFGHLTLPSIAGRYLLLFNSCYKKKMYAFDIQCWKYEGEENRISTLFKHYISDVVNFNQGDLALPIETASSTLGPIASSIGLKTTCSGTLKINVQCLIQSQKFICHEHAHKMKCTTLKQSAGIYSRIHRKILKVLSQFEEARKNLSKIRDQPIHTVS
ncbi:unnamed protein product [Thelazia callipaeda]|uniref:Transcription initiation factor TFIID subunit 2 n=1 Tax=Thelazia callipaeda TaxID=103827 RepID=A0A0N5D5E3_THECL|nr:unnamed protein product [Thelazia callipaeda]